MSVRYLQRSGRLSMTLCANPYHNLSWSVTGYVTPCNNIIGFPKSKSVTEMKQTQEYQDLIKDNINKVNSQFCQRCWDKESVGLVSKRQSDNELNQIYSRLDSNYIKIDAAIGNVCNAACRICGPSSSTMWQKIVPTWEQRNIESTLWLDAISSADRVLQLDFGGGEPWANALPEQIALLEKIILVNRQHLVKIRYNTNGSLWPTRLITLLEQFRQVEITLSLDDIESRFEYNRWPLKWPLVQNNINKFIQLQQTSNVKITVNFTVSVFTWQRANVFKEWAHLHGIKHVNFNILTDPWVYSIKSVPIEVKNNLPSTMFDNIVSSTRQNNWKETFIQLTQQLDQQRNQSFRSTFPELSTVL